MFENNLTKIVIDMVLCIDVSKSMVPIFEQVKQKAISYCKETVNNIKEMLNEYYKGVSYRVKVNTFGDFATNAQSFTQSQFFTINVFSENATKELEDYINSIQPFDSDDATNGLMALSEAINSKWQEYRRGDYFRQVILVFTNSKSAERAVLDYPDCDHVEYANLPTILTDVEELWNSDEIIKQGCNRLIVFAPDCYPWNEFLSWPFSYHAQSNASVDLDNVDFEMSLKFVKINL